MLMSHMLYRTAQSSKVHSTESVLVMGHELTIGVSSTELLVMVWSKRGKINTADQVTIVLCNTLIARCFRQLTGPEDWVSVTLGPLRCD